jgi:hypothetical protein
MKASYVDVGTDAFAEDSAGFFERDRSASAFVDPSARANRAPGSTL